MEENITSKEKILKTAFELFVDRSYENVSLEEIAERSDLSKGAIFHYFDSKYDLAVNCLINHFEAIKKSSFGEIERYEDPKEKLEKTIDMSFELFIKRPKFTRFVLEIYEIGADREEKQEELEVIEILSQFIKETEDIFEELEIPDQRARAHLLWAVVDGIALQYYVWEENPEFPDKEDLKDDIYKMFSNRFEIENERGDKH